MQIFFNIEKRDGLQTCIAVYNADNFEQIKVLFENNENQCLVRIECDKENGNIYVLGFMRDDSGVYHQPFVAQLENEEIINQTNISHSEYDFLFGYKTLECEGFTEKSKEWSSLKYDDCDLTNIENKKFRLADYIK